MPTAFVLRRDAGLLLLLLLLLFGLSSAHAQSGEATAKQQGEKLFMENKPQEAIPLLETALRHAPEDVELYFYLATSYEQLGQLDAALQTYRQGLTHAGARKAQFYFNMGNLEQRRRKYTQALELYTQALQVDRDMTPAYLNRANVNVWLQEYGEAVADYRVYLSMEPRSSQKENIEKMIALLNEKILVAEQERRAAEIKQEEEERRRKALLEEFLNSLEQSGQDTERFSSGTGEVKEYEQEFDIVD